MKTSLRKAFLIVILIGAFTRASEAQNWCWAKSADGLGSEGIAICSDTSGNVIITGEGGNPMTFGAFTLTNSVVYIAKYDTYGNLIWAKGSHDQGVGGGYSVKANLNGDIYVAGVFGGSFIIFDTYTVNSASGNGGLFLAKFDSNGNALWAKSTTGTSTGCGLGVNTDISGNAYLTGYFYSTHIAFDTYTLTNLGGLTAAFLVKYDPSGNVLWAENSSCNGNENYGKSVSADTAGNVFITGCYNGFSVTFSTTTMPNLGILNMFLTKYDKNGVFQWARSAINTGTMSSNSVVTDKSGNAYITGYFGNSSTSLPPISLPYLGGLGDVFIAKYDPNGNVLWAKSYGGPDNEMAYSMSIDTNYIYISGSFTNSTVFGAYTLTSPSQSPDPMFVAILDLNGNVVYATALNSGGDDDSGICVDKQGDVFITGDFYSGTNPAILGYPFVVGNNILYQTGLENPFVAKLTWTSNNCLTEPTPTELKELQVSSYQINLYPNPNAGSFKIQINNEIESGELLLMNSLGQTVCTEKVQRGENKITTKKLSSGLYHYIILQDKQHVGNGKLIIE